jgi:hypothetical protein
MIKKIFLLYLLSISIISLGQSFNEDKTAFGNFIKRMHTAAPFEGVKIVDDYAHQYLVSVISLEKAKYTNPSVMNRIAQVKAQSNANTFLNGSSISMDMLITTKETKDFSNKSTTVIETIEQLKQNSIGFTQGLELLSNFDNTDGKRTVFVFYREILNEKKK